MRLLTFSPAARSHDDLFSNVLLLGALPTFGEKKTTTTADVIIVSNYQKSLGFAGDYTFR